MTQKAAGTAGRKRLGVPMRDFRENYMESTDPKVVIKYEDSVAVAVLTRERILEDNDIQDLEETLIPLIEQNPSIQLVIDFNKVRFLSSSVLGLLIRLSKKIYETGGRLRLCAISEKILEIFKITRLDKIFDISPTRKEAVQKLK